MIQTLRPLALAATLALAAAASAQPALDARLDRLADGLTLDARQTAALDAIADRYADADRPALWAASAEVADVLTDEQIAELRGVARGRRSAARSGRGARAERGARDGRRGRVGARSRRGDRSGARADLTDGQREALRAIRAETREDAAALAAQYRDGAIDAATLADRVRALRAAATDRAAEVLPAEAADRLRERHALRVADAEARAAALGLTDAQRDAVAARRADRRGADRRGPDLRPYLDADGRLDRRALREAMREARPEAVLTDGQRAVVLVHAAIAGRPGRAHRGHRRR